MRVVGIDPSLTCTGLAIIEWNPEPPDSPPTISSLVCAVSTSVVKSKPNGETLAGRWDRIRGVALAITRTATEPKPDLVAIEGPSYGSQGRGTWERAWLWGELVSTLIVLEVPVVEIPPTSRAAFATGKGNASKAAVTAAMARLYPDLLLEPGGEEDQYDALALASMALVLAGGRPCFPMPGYRASAVEKVRQNLP